MNNEIELHPLCAVFPRLEGVEFDALKADIEAHGLLQPIVVHEGKILDGGNRYRACVELDIKPIIVPYRGDDALGFVMSSNLHRRHLSPGQVATIVATATNWLEAAERGDNQYSTTRGPDSTSESRPATLPVYPESGGATLPPPLDDNPEPLRTVAARAAVSGVSVRTQKMADKVARAAPELAKQVAHGTMSLPQAVKQVEKRQPARPNPSKSEMHEAESAAEIAARTDAIAIEPRSRARDIEDSESRGELEKVRDELQALRDHNAELLETLREMHAELDAYRASEAGEGERKLIAANRQILRLEREKQTVELRRDDLMNENAQLKKEVKSLRRKLGVKANG